MSSQEDDIPPTSFQKSVISGNLNSTLLYLYLSGAYLGFSLFTLRIYGPSSHSRNRIVISALTALFAVTAGQVIVQWYTTTNSFVGPTIATRLDSFYMAWGDVSSYLEETINLIMQGISQILADALLIWRCWHILADRRYSRLALACLFVAEISLITAAIIIGALQFLVMKYETNQYARFFNILEGTSLCVTATTSMTATLVIGVHIYSSTSSNPGTRKRHWHIIEVMVQSAALYSFTILAEAITIIINSADVNAFNGAADLNAQFYIESIMTVTTALAPTLMVARLTWAKAKETEDLLIDSTCDIQSTALSVSVTPRGVHMTIPEMKDLVP